MKRFLIVFSALALFVACNNNASENKASEATEVGKEVKLLKQEVMKVHDITMAQMGTMGKLRKQLKEKWQGEEVADTMVYYQAHANLQKAHDKMMDWMAYFTKFYDDNSEAETKIKFLQGEKDKIASLAKFTDKSIAEAEELLAE